MAETVNQETKATVGATNDPGKTFTQEELDRVVNDSLKREREKYEKYGNLDALKEKADKFDENEEAAKSELQKASEKIASLTNELKSLKKGEEVRLIREKIAAETGVPANLLTADTEDACKEQAQGILSFANPSYPEVKDGGEAHAPETNNTARAFSDWANQVF